MQTLVDIPEIDLKALAALAQARTLTPEDLIRQAVTKLLTEPPLPLPPATPRAHPFPGFGAWGDRAVDGLEYQLAIRKEWDREWDPD